MISITDTDARNDKQEALAIALGAAAAFMCLPTEHKAASAFLTDLMHAVKSWGFVRLPTAKFTDQFYDALEASGFVAHLRRCVADWDALDEDSPFDVTPGSVDEVLAALSDHIGQ